MGTHSRLSGNNSSNTKFPPPHHQSIIYRTVVLYASWSSKVVIIIIIIFYCNHARAMGIEIVEPNTCIRGCCTSSSIPLHLPPSSYTLLLPIARGKFKPFSNFPRFLFSLPKFSSMFSSCC